MSMRRSCPALTPLIALLSACITPPPPSDGPPTPEEQITNFLHEQRGPFPEAILPPAAEVESVTISPERVTVGLNFRIQREPVRMDTDDRIAEALAPLARHFAPGAEIVITTDGQALDDFVPRTYGGHGPDRDRAAEIPPPPGPALVRPAERAGPAPDRGLLGRHVAMWPSHGWYFDENSGRWQWQRTRQFTAVEDMLPMSFVLPFLAPMLENAGAVTLIPRERDLQTHEVVVDDADGAEFRGPWEIADTPGFRAGINPLPKNLNPHLEGGHHVAECVGPDAPVAPSVTYIPDVPADGDYAVTVSHVANITRAPDAEYVIRHAGGISRVLVNQRMLNHQWIYLGTFTFHEGSDGLRGSVTLEARSSVPGATVSADAVRLGGGMGHVEMEGRVSGYPRYTEGAQYWLQYAGVPGEHAWQWSKWNEYDQDYAGRPEWVNWMHGTPNGPNGAYDIPGGQVPIDCSLAFHTDAGVKDGIVGTLIIYRSAGQAGQDDTAFPDGRPRWLNREYSDLIQTQIVDDLRTQLGPSWTRRDLHDRSLAECRRPNVPSAILELGAHQNFDDMTSMLDPEFRFVASRAIYKGILRFLATEHGFDSVVQPLPPTHFAAEATGPGIFRLTWQAQSDPLEPTAEPSGYLVYHREGGPVGWRWLVSRGGGFGEPIFTEAPALEIRGLDPDVVHSFRVTAVNGGGESFPTPVLSAAWGGEGAPEALIVDAFDRVASAHVVDVPGVREGFDRSIDRGVGFGANTPLIGDQVFFDPNHSWSGESYFTNDFPGHGASLGDRETTLEIGNLFDHTALHAEPLHALGFTVHATTDEALDARGWGDAQPDLVDWVLGEERTVPAPSWATADGVMGPRFEALPGAHRDLIAEHLAGGGRLILSGAHWATDVVGPGGAALSEEGVDFLRGVLGVRWSHHTATRLGEVCVPAEGLFSDLGDFKFEADVGDGVSYGCEAPDGIEGAGDGETVLRYGGARFGAAVLNAPADAPGRSVCFGFPLECVADEGVRRALLEQATATLFRE